MPLLPFPWLPYEELLSVPIGTHYNSAEGVYAHRIARCHRDYSYPGQLVAPSPFGRQASRPKHQVYFTTAPIWRRDAAVPARFR